MITAASWLAMVSNDEAIKHWQEYPVERYGANWDV